MKLIHDSARCFLRMLLLAELFVHSSSRPAHSASLCNMFRSMKSQVDQILSSSKSLHNLADDELINIIAGENRLDSLPRIEHSASQLRTLKVNESLSQMYLYTRSFRLHVDWLKAAKENISLPSESAEGARAHLLQLSSLISTSLQQIKQAVSEPPPPSFPAISSAFDALQFSIEISEHLKVFCNWSQRVLRHLKKVARCPKH